MIDCAGCDVRSECAFRTRWAAPQIGACCIGILTSGKLTNIQSSLCILAGTRSSFCFRKLFHNEESIFARSAGSAWPCCFFAKFLRAADAIHTSNETCAEKKHNEQSDQRFFCVVPRPFGRLRRFLSRSSYLGQLLLWFDWDDQWGICKWQMRKIWYWHKTSLVSTLLENE